MSGKWAIVLFFHSILWSLFAIIETISTKDHPAAKVIMFVIFFFIAYQISKHFLHTNKKSFYVTLLVMSLFFAGQRIYIAII